MNTTRFTLLVAGLLAASVASAAINIDTVFVGDAGNINDSTNFGGVSYDYHIGTAPVTNAQYTSFLNATASSDPHGLWNSNMGSSVHGGISRNGSDGSYSYSVRTASSGFNNGQSMANKPVNYVSFWDAARFTNWLTSGNTETGVYNLGGVTSPDNSTITRDTTAWANGGVAIASENEWYKAAYYDGNGGYYDYPTQSNTAPTAENPPGGANSANYDNVVGTVTDVGAYASSASYYGTFDQGGNVWEWNDAIVTTSTRDLRGGSFFVSDLGLQSSFRNYYASATYESTDVGFRVSSLEPIPEPSTYAAILGIMGLAFVLIRRRGGRVEA